MHLVLIITTSTYQEEATLWHSNLRATELMPLEGSISHRIDRFDFIKKGICPKSFRNAGRINKTYQVSFWQHVSKSLIHHCVL